VRTWANPYAGRDFRRRERTDEKTFAGEDHADAQSRADHPMKKRGGPSNAVRFTLQPTRSTSHWRSQKTWPTRFLNGRRRVSRSGNAGIHVAARIGRVHNRSRSINRADRTERPTWDRTPPASCDRSFSPARRSNRGSRKAAFSITTRHAAQCRPWTGQFGTHQKPSCWGVRFSMDRGRNSFVLSNTSLT